MYAYTVSTRIFHNHYDMVIDKKHSKNQDELLYCIIQTRRPNRQRSSAEKAFETQETGQRARRTNMEALLLHGCQQPKICGQNGQSQ